MLSANVGEAVEAAGVAEEERVVRQFGEDREEDGKVRFVTVGNGGKVKLWKEGAGKAFLESKTLTGGVESNAKSNTDFQAARRDVCGVSFSRGWGDADGCDWRCESAVL